MSGKTARDFFTEQEAEQIVKTIAQAEKRTSGEIRLHVEDACAVPVLQRAEEVFVKYGMHQTAEHNGVLFYLAVKSHHFAVAGDSGIHQKVTQDFWEEIRKIVLQHFKEERYAEGLCRGIELCGLQLQKYFPLKENDKNELSDEISFG